jgi:hypothetical protein
MRVIHLEMRHALLRTTTIIIVLFRRRVMLRQTNVIPSPTLQQRWRALTQIRAHMIFVVQIIQPQCVFIIQWKMAQRVLQVERMERAKQACVLVVRLTVHTVLSTTRAYAHVFPTQLAHDRRRVFRWIKKILMILSRNYRRRHSLIR